MIYFFLKIYFQFYERTYFRKIYVLGEEKVPKNKPAFIASNHPNGFLDGIVISAMLKKSTYIFVRGDVFKKAWSNFLLRSFKLIPIFRVRDGNARESVKQNNRSYDQLFKMFEQNTQVMIFPESDSKPVKRLRELKKGTARIVLDMESRSENKMNVAIVPTGMNYSNFHTYGNEVMIHLTHPIYFDSIRKPDMSDSEAMFAFTDALFSQMKACVVHVPEGDEVIAEIGFDLIRACHPVGIKRISRDHTIFNQKFALGEMLQKNTSVGFHEALNNYYKGLTDNGLNHKNNPPSAIQSYLAMMFFVPCYLSFLVTIAFVKVGRLVANTKVKLPELYDSVMFGVGMALNLFFDIICITSLSLIFGWESVLLYIGFRCLAIWHYPTLDQLRRYINMVKWTRLKLVNRTNYDSLVHQHQMLWDQIRQNSNG